MLQELQNITDNTDAKFSDAPAFDSKRMKGYFCSHTVFNLTLPVPIPDKQKKLT